MKKVIILLMATMMFLSTSLSAFAATTELGGNGDSRTRSWVTYYSYDSDEKMVQNMSATVTSIYFATYATRTNTYWL